MTELIKNEIGDNKISNKIGEINWVEAKIKDSYKEIMETKGELKDLKGAIAENLSGEKLKATLENELTIDHVKNVVNQAVTKFGGKSDMVTFNNVYAEMGAGLVFNLQLALAKLGCNFSRGIDGMYGKDTTARVKEFQNAWNVAHPTEALSADGWAGSNTLQKIVTALGDAAWDKTKVVTGKAEEAPAPAPAKKPEATKKAPTPSKDKAPAPEATKKAPQPAPKPEQKEQPVKTGELPTTVTYKQAKADNVHYFVNPDGNVFVKGDFDWLNPADSNNYAIKKLANPQEKKNGYKLPPQEKKVVKETPKPVEKPKAPEAKKGPTPEEMKKALDDMRKDIPNIQAQLQKEGFKFDPNTQIILTDSPIPAGTEIRSGWNNGNKIIYYRANTLKGKEDVLAQLRKIVKK